MNSAPQEIRLLADKVLQQFPEFETAYDPAATVIGHRLEIRRTHKGYGSFADIDKIRQVQRDLLRMLRASGYRAHLGREDREGFVIRIEDPGKKPKVPDLQEEVRRVLNQRESSS